MPLQALATDPTARLCADIQAAQAGGPLSLSQRSLLAVEYQRPIGYRLDISIEGELERFSLADVA